MPKQGHLSSDEEELVFLFRKLRDPARQVFALEQLEILVAAAVEADEEIERRLVETSQLGQQDQK